MLTEENIMAMLARRGNPKPTEHKKNRLSGFGVKGATARWGKRTIAERFWALVNIGAKDECWTWKHKTTNRYPVLVVRGVNYIANRVAYVLTTNKPLSPLDCVCHSCDNTQCVNPNHLFIGTHRENMQDMKRKGRHVTPRNGIRFIKGHITPVKLNADKAWSIRHLVAAGHVQADIARSFGVSATMVSRIVRNLAWVPHIR